MYGWTTSTYINYDTVRTIVPSASNVCALQSYAAYPTWNGHACTCHFVLALHFSSVRADLWRLSALRMQGFVRGPHSGPPLAACALTRLSLRVVPPLEPGGTDAVGGTNPGSRMLRVAGHGTVGLEGGLLLRYGGTAGRRQGDEDGGHHPFGRRRRCHGCGRPTRSQNTGHCSGRPPILSLQKRHTAQPNNPNCKYRKGKKN